MSNLDSRSRSDIGRAARRKGIDAEQAVARYLAHNGWPEARRYVQTGWTVGDRRNHDRGDIDGTPGLTWQVKTDTSDMRGVALDRALAACVDQTVAAGHDFGVLVFRRAGKSDPGRWWAWIPVGDLHAVIDKAHNPDVLTVTEPAHQAPACLELGHLVPLLHDAGYGAPAINFGDQR